MACLSPMPALSRELLCAVKIFPKEKYVFLADFDLVCVRLYANVMIVGWLIVTHRDICQGNITSAWHQQHLCDWRSVRFFLYNKIKHLLDTLIQKIFFLDNKNKYFLGWADRYFGYKRTTAAHIAVVCGDWMACLQDGGQTIDSFDNKNK